MDNYSLDNIHKWKYIYNNYTDRWKDFYKSYVNNNNEWIGICIRCNKTTDNGVGWKWCNSCFSEYNKKIKKYGQRANKLLKCKNELTFCKYTGCNKKELQLYIESKFDCNMNWNNKTKYWQIDHIYPLSWFNIENDTELFYVCHFTNLQPIEKEYNMTIKNSKIF